MLLFRKTACIPKSMHYFIDISADSGYILFVNGVRVAQGPCKSNSFVRYYDRLDLAEYLQEGENTIAVRACRYSGNRWQAFQFQAGASSIINTGHAGFFLRDLETSTFSTDASWKCCPESGYHFCQTQGFLPDFERVDGRIRQNQWEIGSFDDSEWEQAVQLIDDQPYDIYGAVNPWQLEPRPIPMLYEKAIAFQRETGGVDLLSRWNQGLPYEIKPNQTVEVELDVGYLTSAYVNLCLMGGMDAEITLLYAESYQEKDNDGAFHKAVRDNSQNGLLMGYTDTYIAGNGLQHYEPYYFRTFRFLKLTVQTKESPLQLNGITLRETGYPLEIEGSFCSNRPEDQRCYEISIRTLQRCMHDTFEDCPYWEQLQYLQDTMLEAAFVYTLSHDIRLIRKAIHDFYSSIQPNGLTASSYPNNKLQIIPGFSLIWVMMLEQYYCYTGDPLILEKYLPGVEQILRYFTERISPDSDLAVNIGYWEFVDWVDDWMDNKGACIPRECDGIPCNYIYNMMLAYAHRVTAQFYTELALPDMAKRHQNIYSRLREALRAQAYDSSRQLYRHCSVQGQFSKHAQIWAVLSGVAEEQQSVSVMKACLQDPSLSEPSYCYAYYYFRALEQAGLYEQSDPIWEKWRKLLPLGVTTWPEDDVTQRSECHAWSSVLLYEYAACILGVRPLAPGYRKLQIAPHSLGRTCASGVVCIPQGHVSVSWEKKSNGFVVDIHLPGAIPTEVVFPDGKRMFFNQAEIHADCSEPSFQERGVVV